MQFPFPSPCDQPEPVNNRPGPAVNYEIVSRMPWLVAEPESVWSIFGTTTDGERFGPELAIVVPYSADQGGKPLFALVHPGNYVLGPWRLPPVVPAHRISRAHRLALVMADDPTTAYNRDEQDLIDAQEDHR